MRRFHSRRIDRGRTSIPSSQSLPGILIRQQRLLALLDGIPCSQYIVLTFGLVRQDIRCKNTPFTAFIVEGKVGEKVVFRVLLLLLYIFI